jgi:anaerobic magnesium-protoporphyrin IX monomethyl ester cyclase
MSSWYDCVLISIPKHYLKEPKAQVPLGILYLAAVLERGGFSCLVKDFSAITTEEAIRELPHAVLYGISVTSLEIPGAHLLIKEYKKINPKARFILGGPGVSLSPEMVDKNLVDSVFIGEAESSICTVVDDAKRAELKKEYYGSPILDLDEIPFPARNKLDYKGGRIFTFQEGDSTVILSSRGCNRNCAFCAAPSLRASRIRYRAVSRVKDEIIDVKESLGIKNFRFSDEIFNANEERAKRLSDEIGGIKINWRVSCASNPLSESLLSRMKDAGCVEISLGVEAFDNNVLKALKKGENIEDHVRAIELIMGQGMVARLLMMVGLPSQSRETIEANKFWLKKFQGATVCCTSFVPLPGSMIWREPSRFGVEILDKNLENYNFYMFDKKGKRSLKPIIKQTRRSLEEFTEESEEFRCWLEENVILNRGGE